MTKGILMYIVVNGEKFEDIQFVGNEYKSMGDS